MASNMIYKNLLLIRDPTLQTNCLVYGKIKLYTLPIPTLLEPLTYLRLTFETKNHTFSYKNYSSSYILRIYNLCSYKKNCYIFVGC